MHTLPDSDDLFLQFFDPWYEDANRKRRGEFRGDVSRCDTERVIRWVVPGRKTDMVARKAATEGFADY